MIKHKYFLAKILFILFCHLTWAQATEEVPVTTVEYQALVDLYNTTDGDNWRNKWDISTNNIHTGSWYGVTAENGHITEINLGSNNLTGAIPASFGNLEFLRNLDLFDSTSSSLRNDLSITDLNNLSELANLEYLDLSYCSLSGSLPTSWSKLTNLQTLILSNNALEGAVFEGLGDLKEITILNIQNNNFSSISDDIGSLGSLQTLNVFNNNIGGSLPKVLEELTALTSLNIQTNELTGIDAFLPTSVLLTIISQTITLNNFTYVGEDVVLTDLPEITKYNRSTNDFSLRPDFILYLRGSNIATLTMDEDGSLTIPAESISSIGQEDDLYLTQNRPFTSGASYSSRINFETITIDTPAVPEDEYQALVDFYNAMNGENWIVQWPIETNNLNEGAWEGVSIVNGHITEIELRDGRVQGAIPESFGNLKYLKKLDLHNNNINTDYGNGIGLSATDLNNLSGLESLEYLDLSECNLIGEVPESWSQLVNLQTLNLYTNSIEGVVFEGIGELKLLEVLNLYNNSLIGFPSDIGSLESLITFNIYSNNISGSLPKALEGLTALRTLNATTNNISGIEAYLPTTVSLNINNQTLSLDNFTYVGEDVVLTDLPEITKYNRSANDFSLRADFILYLRGSNIATLVMDEDGSLTIPAESISSIGQNDDLYLTQNRPITTGASYSTRINFETVTIDLPTVPEDEYQALVDFYNAMNGENWIDQWPIETNSLNEGAWEGVSIVNGHITEIELRDGRVQGAIPESFSNLKYLKKLDLHNSNINTDYGNGIGLSATDLNNLSGLESLEYLDLSECNLIGEVPESWSQLVNLQTLNLYTNSVEGVVFEGIGELKLLEVLNLYNNSLTGFPSDIGGLESLITFNIYSNNISGSLPKALEELTALRTLNVTTNNITGIEAFLPTTVSLSLNSQTLSLDNFTYVGEDVVLTDLPEITKYNRSTNDFSLRADFILYLRGSNIGTLVMDEDGNLTIPAESISSIGQNDDLYLTQNRPFTTGASYSTRINFDTITIDLPAVPDDEYQALVDFYTTMNGENWIDQWPIETNSLNEGAWEGVSIENGHITEIELQGDRVQGAIPESFGNLKYLKILDLHDNNINIDYGNGIGLIATDLNNLSGLESLEYLDLSECNLIGNTIPESWSNLTQLQTLNLSRNSLLDVDRSFNTLTPESLNFNSQEITFDSVEVSGDKITIELPLYMAMKLQDNVISFDANNEFRLYVNNVNEKTAFSNDGKLVFSDISLLELQETDQIRINQVNGIALGSNINYTSVNFGLPLVDEEFEILKKIYEETAGENWTNTWDITENTVNQIAWFGVSLSEGHVIGLDLFNNNLTGTIPPEITGLTYLETLNLSNNNLTGALPSNLELLSALEVLDLNSNQLSGTITPKIADLKRLKKFAIGDNNFTGSIPSALSDFEVLEHLDISSNGFDFIEKKLYYTSSNTFIDLRNQIINYNTTLSLNDNLLEVTLPDIVRYDLEDNNFEAANSFSLLVNNLTHDTTVLNEEGEIVFNNVRISEIPIDAFISVRQTTGSFLNTEFIFDGIEDRSNVPVFEEEYLALVNFYEQLNGTDWLNQWDTSSNNLHINKWYGVTTYDGHIVGIDLSNNNVSGVIPNVVSALPFLTELNLASNKITDISNGIPSTLNLTIDRQTNNMGSLNLSRTVTINDNRINRYDHEQTNFINQTYYLTIGGFSKTLNMPEEGVKLIDLITNWNVPKGQKIVLRQNSGDAINSIVDFDLNFQDGDANIDDTVNVLDIQTTINHILGDYVPYFNFYGANVNDDNFVNILDLIGQVNAIQNANNTNTTLNNISSTTRSSKSLVNETKSLLAVNNGELVLDPNGYEITSFEIVLEGVTLSQIEESISEIDFNVYLNQKENEVSIIGFSLNNALNTQQALAEINATNASIVSVLLSDKQANEIPFEIIPQFTLSNNDFDDLQLDNNIHSNKLKNYPNPFISETLIEFYSDKEYAKAIILISDISGKNIVTETINSIAKGKNTYVFNRANSMQSGTYFYAIKLGNEPVAKSLNGKMIIN